MEKDFDENEDFSDDVLKFLADFAEKNPQEIKLSENLDQIMSEDRKLLKKLAE